MGFLGTIVVAGCGGTTVPPGGDVLFRDDFTTSTLQQGWTEEGAGSENFDLAARSGFLRITPLPPPAGGELAAFAVVSREVTGDFVLLTRIVFDPAADRQLAGLVAAGEDDRTVSFGLLIAARDTGDFQGLSAVAEQPGGATPAVAFRALDANDLLLQMERTGDIFRVSYSTDGTNFFVVGNLSTVLSDTVRVGVGNIVRENCEANCSEGSAADFDYFEIRRPASS
jgi:beta-xylosidase